MLDYNKLKDTVQLGLLEPLDHPWKECFIHNIAPFFDPKSVSFIYECTSDRKTVALGLYRFLDPEKIGYIGQCTECKDIYFLEHPNPEVLIFGV
jgi:hypothetical protein